MRNKPRLIFLLNSAQRHLQQWIAQQTPFAGAEPAPSPAQSGVLFALDLADGCTMGELATTLDLAPSAVSGLIQRMQTLGWLTRQACPQDGRTQRVWLSESGRRLLPPLKHNARSLNARLSAGFSEAELQTVVRWLTHVQQLSPNETPKARAP